MLRKKRLSVYHHDFQQRLNENIPNLKLDWISIWGSSLSDVYFAIVNSLRADVAELVDALDLGSSFFGSEGSSPFIRIED